MSLLSYRNKFYQKKVVLFGSGPSLKQSSLQEFPQHLKAGVNGTIIHPEFRNLDLYFWAGDLDTRKHPTPSEKPIRNNIPKLPEHCLKFVNTRINGSTRHPMLGQTQILENEATNLGFEMYNILFGKSKEHPVHTWYADVNKGLDAVSIAFASCQLLLYMGFSEIVLVGFDCSSSHSYSDMLEKDKCDWKDNQLVERWIRFKAFVEKCYPTTKISVVRPLGLKDVFTTYDSST